MSEHSNADALALWHRKLWGTEEFHIDLLARDKVGRSLWVSSTVTPILDAAALAPYFSEFALMRNRFRVEVEWLIVALRRLRLFDAPELSKEQIVTFRSWVTDFSLADARQIKKIEVRTRHDVKAVEYYLRQRLAEAGCSPFAPLVHVCCTSEDINNIAHALMLREGLFDVWRPALDRGIAALVALARPHLATPMLSRTHGQPASPTTLGKELAVFVARLRRQRAHLDKLVFLGKFSGAVGNFNAHVSAYRCGLATDGPGVPRRFRTGDADRNYTDRAA